MSTTDIPLPSSTGGAPAPAARTRPFLWSVRREIWESRSLYIAPAALAALFLCGNLLSLFGLRHRGSEVDAMAPAQQHLRSSCCSRPRTLTRLQSCRSITGRPAPDISSTGSAVS